MGELYYFGYSNRFKGGYAILFRLIRDNRIGFGICFGLGWREGGVWVVVVILLF